VTGRFDLSKYQTVKERKDLFYKDHAGVYLPILITDPVNIGEEAAYIVPVWKDANGAIAGADRLAGTVEKCGNIDLRLAILIMAPDSIGTAYENKGMTGASKTSWTENAEESAIGRALDNLGYHGNGKCSREEILKVQEVEELAGERGVAPQPEPTVEKSPFDEGEISVYEGVNLPQPEPTVEKSPFDEGEISVYEGVNLPPKGSKGINTARAILGHAQTMGWSEADFVAWQTSVVNKPFSQINAAQAELLLNKIKEIGKEGGAS